MKMKLTAAQEKFYNKYGKEPRPYTQADKLLEQVKSRTVTLLKDVEYPCGFNDKSKCINYQDDVDPRNPSRDNCCCGGCYDSLGFFRNMLTDKDDIDYYIRHFTETGFYLKETGCVLPRGKRSVICLSYICWQVSKKMDLEHLIIHRTATELLRTIEFWHADNVRSDNVFGA